jgi:hypothetical protein
METAKAKAFTDKTKGNNLGKARKEAVSEDV